MEKSNVFATLQVVVSESDDDAAAFNDTIPLESFGQVNRSH